VFGLVNFFLNLFFVFFTWVLKILVDFFCKFCLFCFSFLVSIFSFLEKPFIFTLRVLFAVFFFVRYFCVSILKQIAYSLNITWFWLKVISFFKNRTAISTVCLTWFISYIQIFNWIYIKLWKLFIDFLFFTVWRNRFKFIFYCYKVYWVFVLCFFFCILGFLHKSLFIALGLNFKFSTLQLDTLEGITFILISFFNINYVLVYFYTIFQYFFVKPVLSDIGFLLSFCNCWTQNYFDFDLHLQYSCVLCNMLVGLFSFCYYSFLLFIHTSGLLYVTYFFFWIILSVFVVLLIGYIYRYFGIIFHKFVSLSLFTYFILFTTLYYTCCNVIFYTKLVVTSFATLLDVLFLLPHQTWFLDTPFFFFFYIFFFLTLVVSWFFYSYLGLYGIFRLNVVSLFLFWVSLLFFLNPILFEQRVFIVRFGGWLFLSVGSTVDFYFLFDTISFSFILLTTTIALFVFFFAFSYFRYEPLTDRFLLFLLSFVVSMVFLLSAGNTIMLFLGWELIGLTSFFLINFWVTKTTTLKSAFKAFTFNKVSDFFIFIFLITTYSIFYTFDILSINNQIYQYEYNYIYIFNTKICYVELLSLLILGAAFIKSAQFGGHVWLPDSMEAPVPASALIHSATLVSAGVYLILRFNSFFDISLFSRCLIPLVGSLTAAYGGVCAIAQSDIKKTLAYSTISHCGFLMVLCSTEMNEFTILYLYVHGFFKAGVFMCVGNVLRISRGYQDTRRMGGLLKYLPFEYFCITIGILNLAGLPFTFGFFIKHILLISVNSNIYLYYFVLINSLIGAVSGLFYSYRLITYTFIDFKKADKIMYSSLNRVNYNSVFYTNSSLMSTISIFCLFVVAYVLIYFLLRGFLFNNFLFSDYLNTTTLTTIYSIKNLSYGFLINSFFLNWLVLVVLFFFFFGASRVAHKKPQYFNFMYVTVLFLIFTFFFSFFL